MHALGRVLTHEPIVCPHRRNSGYGGHEGTSSGMGGTDSFGGGDIGLGVMYGTTGFFLGV